MPRNETPMIDLTPAQVIAINALTEGQSITHAAVAAGVDRSTVHRWSRTHSFQAAHNGAKNELRTETATRLAATAVRAAETVDKAISEGNVAAALSRWG